MNLIIIAIIHIIVLYNILKIKKLKHGITFLRKDSNNEYLDILALNISVSIMFIIIFFSNQEVVLSRSSFFGFIIVTIIMVVAIQKSLQIYYKQKMLKKI